MSKTTVTGKEWVMDTATQLIEERIPFSIAPGGPADAWEFTVADEFAEKLETAIDDNEEIL